MTAAITLWLAFVLAAATIAWFGPKRQAVAFFLVALATAPAAFLTLGHAAPWQPTKGQYKVLGARIDVDKAIYILLDADPEPRLYKLPYSKEVAGDLQSATDGSEAHGSSVILYMGGRIPEFTEGNERNREPPKPAEPPALVTQ